MIKKAKGGISFVICSLLICLLWIPAAQAAEVTIELRNSQGVLARTVTVSGNSAEYAVANVIADTYTVKVSKANHAVRTYTVTVRDADVVQDMSIRPIGNVTGDGKATAADYSRLLAHVKKVSPMW